MDRIEKLKEFLKETPADSFLQHALALEYIKLDNDEEAKRLFEIVLDREPGYVGSYYHLGKLLENSGEKDLASEWYEKGMAAAKAAGDGHAHNELMGAYEDLSE